jgi:hypothetical protein
VNGDGPQPHGADGRVVVVGRRGINIDIVVPEPHNDSAPGGLLDWEDGISIWLVKIREKAGRTLCVGWLKMEGARKRRTH